MQNNEPELTLNAKAAIIKFVLRLLAVPSLIAAVLIFFLGFFIKEVAYNKAYYESKTKIEQFSVKAKDSAETIAGIEDTVKRNANTIIDAQQGLDKLMGDINLLEQKKITLDEIFKNAQSHASTIKKILEPLQGQLTDDKIGQSKLQAMELKLNASLSGMIDKRLSDLYQSEYFE